MIKKSKTAGTAKTKKAAKPAAKKTVKKTKETRTEIVFILDRSGSMSGRETDVIGGFNRMLAEQQGKKGECYVSTVLFDDNSEVLHNRIPVADVRPLTDKEYFVRGCTAYYDALGRGILHHILVQRHLPEGKRADKVLFVVMTDGYENASQEFSGETLRRLVIEEQEKWGWEFIFIGAGIDAIQAAADIGIRAENAINTVADKSGIGATWVSMTAAVTNIREGRQMCCNEDGTSYRAAVDRDFQSRKKQ